MANPIPFIAQATPGEAPAGAIPASFYGLESDKPAIEALTPLAGGADLPTVVTKVNAIIAALKA